MTTESNVAVKSRRRRVFAVGALVFIAGLVFAIAAFGPHRFAFIDRFGGKRDLHEEIQVQGVAEGMGGLRPNSLVMRCYVFKAPAKQVAAAMTQELTRDGWAIVEKDQFEIDFVKGRELAMFSYVGGEAPGTTCMVIVTRPTSWFRDEWEALKERLGIE